MSRPSKYPEGRAASWGIVFLLCAAWAGLGDDGAVAKDDAKAVTSRVVRNFYELHDGVTVMRTFPTTTGPIQEQFRKAGITMAPLADEPKGNNKRFVGSSRVVWKELHGTVDAPFSKHQFTVQHRAGIRLTFNRLQAVVAMTISGPTTNTDVGMDLLFFDANGKLIKKVNADTKHIKRRNHDSRGAVFRGLQTEKPAIWEVHIIPTRIPDNVKIVLACIDYFSFSPHLANPQTIDDIKELVEVLGSARYATREEATRRLSSFGPRILPVLRRLNTEDDPEVRMRLAKVMKVLEAKKVNLTPDGKTD